MKIVLGGEEESEKNRVLLGPLREETRKLITLDACIALEGEGGICVHDRFGAQ